MNYLEVSCERKVIYHPYSQRVRGLLTIDDLVVHFLGLEVVEADGVEGFVGAGVAAGEEVDEAGIVLGVGVDAGVAFGEEEDQGKAFGPEAKGGGVENHGARSFCGLVHGLG